MRIPRHVGEWEQLRSEQVSTSQILKLTGCFRVMSPFGFARPLLCSAHDTTLGLAVRTHVKGGGGQRRGRGGGSRVQEGTPLFQPRLV